MQRADSYPDAISVRVKAMLTRRRPNAVACALANKLARIACAISARGTHYEDRRPALAD